MGILTVGSVAKMSLELTLGICIKLFCDNGRIHWRDLVNDVLFWVPGVQQLPGDGLSREVAAEAPAPGVHEDVETPLAAK